MKKIISLTLTVVLTAAICLSFTGCGTEYEDTNGDDVYTLQTITDDDIIGLSTGASGLSYDVENTGELPFSSEVSSKNFNGVEEIFYTDQIIASDINVYIGTMNVRGGNFKLVAVNNDEIIKEFDLDAFNETFQFEDIKGTFSIRVAGESASFKFYIEVN